MRGSAQREFHGPHADSTGWIGTWDRQHEHWRALQARAWSCFGVGAPMAPAPAAPALQHHYQRWSQVPSAGQLAD